MKGVHFVQLHAIVQNPKHVTIYLLNMPSRSAGYSDAASPTSALPHIPDMYPNSTPSPRTSSCQIHMQSSHYLNTITFIFIFDNGAVVEQPTTPIAGSVCDSSARGRTHHHSRQQRRLSHTRIIEADKWADGSFPKRCCAL